MVHALQCNVITLTLKQGAHNGNKPLLLVSLLSVIMVLLLDFVVAIARNAMASMYRKFNANRAFK